MSLREGGKRNNIYFWSDKTALELDRECILLLRVYFTPFVKIKKTSKDALQEINM